jgi:hypothetical protein
LQELYGLKVELRSGLGRTRRESVINITYKRKSLLCIAWRHSEGSQQTTGAAFESPSKILLYIFMIASFVGAGKFYFR